MSSTTTLPSTEEPKARVSLESAEPVASRSGSGWLVGPWFDLLLVANLAWPLAVLIQLDEGFGGQQGLLFWQVYFVTTPHRWITLAIVFFDRQRFRERRRSFIGIALAIVLVCLGVRLGTGGLTCLLAIDYLWNAWHFAAQHHGIFRIYRRSESQQGRLLLQLERWGFRLFLLYVIFRVASYTLTSEAVSASLSPADWLVLVIPAWLILRELLPGRDKIWAATCYLASVCGLYSCLLLAVHWQRPALVLSLTTAAALFHAIEYLSVVGWATKGRHAKQGGQMGLLAHLVPQWLLALGMFILILGIGGWMMDQYWMQWWMLINVMVAFAHYAYDGLIWRSRPARPAASLQAAS